MNDFVELFATFYYDGKNWSCWTSESRPSTTNEHVYRIRVPVPEEIQIPKAAVDAEIIGKEEE